MAKEKFVWDPKDIVFEDEEDDVRKGGEGSGKPPGYGGGEAGGGGTGSPAERAASVNPVGRKVVRVTELPGKPGNVDVVRIGIEYDKQTPLDYADDVARAVGASNWGRWAIVEDYRGIWYDMPKKVEKSWSFGKGGPGSGKPSGYGGAGGREEGIKPTSSFKPKEVFTHYIPKAQWADHSKAWIKANREVGACEARVGHLRVAAFNAGEGKRKEVLLSLANGLYDKMAKTLEARDAMRKQAAGGEVDMVEAEELAGVDISGIWNAVIAEVARQYEMTEAQVREMAYMVEYVPGAAQPTFKFMKVDGKKHIVGGIIYEPDVVDSQGDYTDKDEIEKAMCSFMERYSSDTKRIKVMHKGVAYHFPILECFQPEEDTKKGKDVVKAGSWWLSVKVTNDEIWKAIEDGKITGFSMGGRAGATQTTTAKWGGWPGAGEESS